MKILGEYKNVPGVYIMRCLISHKYYIGESLDIAGRMKQYKYTKSRVIDRAISKYGIDNFEVMVEYLPHFDKDSLVELEEQMILKFDCLVPNGYNVCSKSNNTSGYKMSDENKQKMSMRMMGNKNLLGHTHSPETRKKLSKSCSVANNKPEYKEKMSNSLKGRVITKEHRENLSKSLTGRKFSNEHIESLSKVRKGVKKSEEFKNNIREVYRKKREALSQDMIINSLKFENFSDDVVAGRLLQDKIVISRKTYKCNHCGNDIAQKEKIRTRSIKNKGVIKAYRWCNACITHMANMILNQDYDEHKREYDNRCIVPRLNFID